MILVLMLLISAKWGDAAIGLRAIASGGNATALGRSATATAANAIAIGGGNGDSATDNTEKTEATGEKIHCYWLQC